MRWMIYLIGAPILWKSCGQKSIALSLTEAEYIRISEVCQEILFIKANLEILGVEIEYPIIVHVNNQGAIYFANNEGASMRTKHVDVRYHFV